MDIVALISNAFSAVSNYFGWAKVVQEEKNTPEMKANANAQVRSDESDKINSQIADAHSKDPKTAAKGQDALRKEFSED